MRKTKFARIWIKMKQLSFKAKLGFFTCAAISSPNIQKHNVPNYLIQNTLCIAINNMFLENWTSVRSRPATLNLNVSIVFSFILQQSERGLWCWTTFSKHATADKFCIHLANLPTQTCEPKLLFSWRCSARSGWIATNKPDSEIKIAKKKNR